MGEMKMKNSDKKQTVNARRTPKSIATAINRMYSKSAPLLIGEALLLGFVAIFMVLRPLAMLAALTIVIGVGLIVFGLYRTIAGFVAPRGVGGGWFDVSFGGLNVVLGVLFCIYPVGSIISLVYVFLILFAIKSVRALIFAINMARARFGHYIVNLILAVATVAVAVALLIWPAVGAITMVYYVAITLLLYAMTDVYMFIELWRLRREISE